MIGKRDYEVYAQKVEKKNTIDQEHQIYCRVKFVRRRKKKGLLIRNVQLTPL